MALVLDEHDLDRINSRIQSTLNFRFRQLTITSTQWIPDTEGDLHDGTVTLEEDDIQPIQNKIYTYSSTVLQCLRIIVCDNTIIFDVNNKLRSPFDHSRVKKAYGNRPGCVGKRGKLGKKGPPGRRGYLGGKGTPGGPGFSGPTGIPGHHGMPGPYGDPGDPIIIQELTHFNSVVNLHYSCTITQIHVWMDEVDRTFKFNLIYTDENKHDDPNTGIIPLTYSELDDIMNEVNDVLEVEYNDFIVTAYLEFIDGVLCLFGE